MRALNNVDIRTFGSFWFILHHTVNFLIQQRHSDQRIGDCGKYDVHM